MQAVTHTLTDGFSKVTIQHSGEPLDLQQLVITSGFWIGLGLLVLVHAILATAVANDVDRLAKSGRRAHYMGSEGWWFVVVFTGIVGIAAHWVMHYSTFRDVGTDRGDVGG